MIEHLFEEVKRGLPVVPLVVPLQQDVQWDGDPAGFLDDDAGHVAPGEEAGGDDAGLGQRQPDADGDHPSGVADRATDLGQCEEGV